MVTFVFVHGAWHGAWCWRWLTPELTRRGHTCEAVELPITDPDATLGDYADAVEAVVAGAEEVVLVGHSIAGLVLPIVAARSTAVCHTVYIGGMLAAPGQSMRELAGSGEVFAPGWSQRAAAQTTGGDGSSAWPAEAAAETFYHDCPAERAVSAAESLRPQYWRFGKDPCPLPAYPRTPATYLLCREDRVIDPAWSRRAAPRLLGVPAEEMPGGHAPFLSRPAQLADRLLATVR